MQHRMAKSKHKKKFALRQSSLLMRIAPAGWFQRLPSSLRVVIKATLITLGIPLLLVAMPALLYFTAKADYSNSQKELNTVSMLALLGFLLIMLAIAISIGSSLIHLFQSGEFCSRPSRYAGLYCITYNKGPIIFILWVAANWFVFWLSTTAIVGGVRYLVSTTSRDSD
jgi:hypothetical protein